MSPRRGCGRRRCGGGSGSLFVCIVIALAACVGAQEQFPRIAQDGGIVIRFTGILNPGGSGGASGTFNAFPVVIEELYDENDNTVIIIGRAGSRAEMEVGASGQVEPLKWSFPEATDAPYRTFIIKTDSVVNTAGQGTSLTGVWVKFAGMMANDPSAITSTDNGCRPVKRASSIDRDSHVFVAVRALGSSQIYDDEDTTFQSSRYINSVGFFSGKEDALIISKNSVTGAHRWTAICGASGQSSASTPCLFTSTTASTKKGVTVPLLTAGYAATNGPLVIGGQLSSVVTSSGAFVAKFDADTGALQSAYHYPGVCSGSQPSIAYAPDHQTYYVGLVVNGTAHPLHEYIGNISYYPVFALVAHDATTQAIKWVSYSRTTVNCDANVVVDVLRTGSDVLFAYEVPTSKNASIANAKIVNPTAIGNGADLRSVVGSDMCKNPPSIVYGRATESGSVTWFDVLLGGTNPATPAFCLDARVDLDDLKVDIDGSVTMSGTFMWAVESVTTNVYVKTDPATSAYGFIYRFGKDGQAIWITRVGNLDNPPSDAPTGLLVTPDLRLFAHGSALRGASNTLIQTVTSLSTLVVDFNGVSLLQPQYSFRTTIRDSDVYPTVAASSATVTAYEDTDLVVTLTGNKASGQAAAVAARVESFTSAYGQLLQVDGTTAITLDYEEVSDVSGRVIFRPFANVYNATHEAYQIVYRVFQLQELTDGANSYTTRVYSEETGTVSGVILPLPDPPVAIDQTVSMLEDVQTLITLTGFDVDGDSIAGFIITSLPDSALGYLYQVLMGQAVSDLYLGPVIAQTPANVTDSKGRVFFKPIANENGATWFGFKAYNDLVSTSEGNVTVKVAAVNDAPTPTSQTVTLTKLTGGPQLIVLSSDDIDGYSGQLSFFITSNVTHGTLHQYDASKPQFVGDQIIVSTLAYERADVTSVVTVVVPVAGEPSQARVMFVPGDPPRGPSETGTYASFTFNTNDGTQDGSVPATVNIRAACLAGEFASDTLQQCAPCDVGKYNDAESFADTCTACEVGRYARYAGSQTCLPCPNGTRTDVEGTGTCQPCFFGTYQPSEEQVGCLTCEGGKYQDETGKDECKPCKLGQYSRNGAKTCLPCDFGTAGPTTGLANCVPCASGSYAAAEGLEECDPCPTGTFQNVTGQSYCYACPVGTYTQFDGQDECAPCPAGFFGNTTNLTACVPCLAGTYQEATAASFCKECPQGTYSAVESGSTSCIFCPPGSYSSHSGSSVCTDCEVGKFQASSNSSSCTPCAAGSIASSLALRACTPCPSGQFAQNASFCSACPEGKYTPGPGFTDCQPCTPGTFSSSVGSSACTKCSLGRYQNATNSSTCTVAPAGRFANETGLSTAYECAPGTATSSQEASTCTACSPGTYAANGSCVTCWAGTYASASGQTKCDDCVAGKSSGTDGAIGCLSAELGWYVNNTGMPSALKCVAGRFSNETGSVQCYACPKGSTSATAASSCSECDAGRFSPVAASPSCTDCSEGEISGVGATTCQLCSRGYYSAFAKSSQCTPCPAGQIANATGSRACTPCPSGTYSNTTGLSACFVCPEGTSGTQDEGAISCSLCPAGRYKNLTSSLCEACATGRFTSSAGATNCSLCALGSAASVAGSVGCSTCPAGRFAGVTGLSDCAPCPQGTYGPDTGLTKCELCPSSTYASQVGSLSCLSATPGTFANGTGLTTSEPCPVGRYSSNSSAEICIVCAAGSISAITGAQFCTLCPIGTYQPLSGQTRCLDCGLNEFASSGGATTCETCVSPQYVNRTGADACASCRSSEYARFDTRGIWLSCESCPENAECSSDGTITAKKGFWLARDPVTDAIKALECTACEAGGVCGANRRPAEENPLCAQCVDGHVEWNGVCTPCSETNGGIVFALFAASFVFVSFYHVMAQSSSGHTKILVYFGQISVLLIGTEGGFVVYILEIFNLRFMQSTGSACIAPLTAEEKILLELLVPVITYLQFAVIALVSIARRHCRNTRRNVPLRLTYTSYWRTCIALYLLLYNGFYDACLRFLQCRSVPFNGETVDLITSTPQVRCDGDFYRTMHPIVIAGLVLWAVVIPSYLTFKLVQGKVKNRLQNNKWQTLWGVLTSYYDDAFFYWSIVAIMRRTILVTIMAMLESDSLSLKFALVSLFQVIFLVVQVATTPFSDAGDNRMETGSLALLVVIGLLMPAYGEPPFSTFEDVTLFMLSVVPALGLLLWVAWLKAKSVREALIAEKSERALELSAAHSEHIRSQHNMVRQFSSHDAVVPAPSPGDGGTAGHRNVEMEMQGTFFTTNPVYEQRISHDEGRQTPTPPDEVAEMEQQPSLSHKSHRQMSDDDLGGTS